MHSYDYLPAKNELFKIQQERERRRKQTKVWRGPVEVGKAGALERERERERGGGVVSFIYSGTVLWGVLEACVGKVGLFVE